MVFIILVQINFKKQLNTKYKLELSVIIVNYKTPQLLKECVSSLFQNQQGFEMEVIVVDNDSQDNSQELVLASFPTVIWENSGYNAGFGRANNIGIKKAKGDYLLILNPDSYIKSDFLARFLAYYKEKDVNNSLGLLTCRIISSVNASLLVGSGRGFLGLKRYIEANPIFIFLTRRFNSKEKKYKASIEHYTNHQIDFTSGACVMIKKSKVIENNLYFDEDFFLYSEDVEWSYRVIKNGFENHFFSEIEVYHVNSASTGKSNFRSKQMLISEYLYLYKTNGAFAYWFLGKIIKFNFYLDLKLLAKSSEYEKIKKLREEEVVFDKWFHLISKEFQRTPSSAQNCLKYVE